MGWRDKKKEVVVQESDYRNPDGTTDFDRWESTKPAEPGNWKFHNSRWAPGSHGHVPPRWVDEPKSRWG